MARLILAVVVAGLTACGGHETPTTSKPPRKAVPPADAGAAATSPAPAADAAATTPDKPTVVASDSKVELRTKIYFRPGDFQLPPRAPAILDAIAGVLESNPQLLVVAVRGHTDSTETNQTTLSKKRAKEVQAYLVGQGVAAKRIPIRGLGQNFPVDTNRTAAGRAKNRRVDFEIIKVGK